MSQSVLVVAAHADDEVLGCGGTIAKLCAQGAVVNVAFLADGVGSRLSNGNQKDAEVVRRQAAAEKACRILGVRSVSFLDFPDNRMDTLALLDIVKAIEDLVARFLPEMILTHHAGDLNVDHRLAHQAVATACRPQTGHSVKTILCFEVPSSTEWQLSGNAPAFVPNWYVDISITLEKKLAALEAYHHELRDWPHPRSSRGVEVLAQWRGATVGVEAAEAFVLGRHIA